jgi:hypothetical protein
VFYSEDNPKPPSLPARPRPKSRPRSELASAHSLISDDDPASASKDLQAPLPSVVSGPKIALPSSNSGPKVFPPATSALPAVNSGPKSLPSSGPKASPAVEAGAVVAPALPRRPQAQDAEMRNRSATAAVNFFFQFPYLAFWLVFC